MADSVDGFGKARRKPHPNGAHGPGWSEWTIPLIPQLPVSGFHVGVVGNYF